VTTLDAAAREVAEVPERRVPPFAVVPGAQVQETLEGRERQVVQLVEDVYRLHSAGSTVNPPSYFLRFPDRPSSRIIALPASVGGDVQVDGIKWISSFPDNVAAGLPRASAVLILNDHETGYPFACLESSVISATRTAAFSALAAERLSASRQRPARLGIFGVGLIARYIHRFLAATGWSFDEIGVYDLSADSAAGFHDYLQRSRDGARITIHERPEALISSSDLIVFATTAGEPHVHNVRWFDHNPLVLHVSLRDLAPEILLASANLVDDVEHCLKANTSPHLVEQQTGSRDFLLGTLGDVTGGRVAVPADRPVVFSPFGLGVLDLAVGKHVYDSVARAGQLKLIDDFFWDLKRYG
jgi:ornithine cyclodeaminase